VRRIKSEGGSMEEREEEWIGRKEKRGVSRKKREGGGLRREKREGGAFFFLC